MNPMREFPTLPAMVQAGTAPRAALVSRWMVVFFLVMAVALGFVPWQQNLPGAGRVVAYAPLERQQTIDTPVEGRVLRWHVIEGTQVKAGDLVAEITDNDPEILDRLLREREALAQRMRFLEDRERSLGERIQGLDGSRRNALDGAVQRIGMAEERVRQGERAVEAAEATLTAARLNYNRQKQLASRGLASTRMVEVATMDHDKSIADLERARAALQAARVERKALEADREKVLTDFDASINDAKASRSSAQSEIANVRGSMQQMDMRVARQSTQRVLAPRNGTILRLLAQPGSELLKSGDPLAAFVPDTQESVVELWVNGNDMPLIAAGDTVRLQFEGWPAVQWVGWPSVAVGTFGGKVLLVDATDNGLGKFRLLVAPDPNDEPWPSRRWLRQGVRTNGWVMLNVVPLGYELWRQFNGFPPVVAMTEPGKDAKGK
ncbi:MAG: HlyD family efflux transporter periplasmic adaptor subunit [Acidobacteria bacterium]|nr:HlyD family efflux transporter periplasmic adaptor subunit [Acidobacteriota bacterium]